MVGHNVLGIKVTTPNRQRVIFKCERDMAAKDHDVVIEKPQHPDSSGGEHQTIEFPYHIIPFPEVTVVIWNILGVFQVVP